MSHKSNVTYDVLSQCIDAVKYWNHFRYFGINKNKKKCYFNDTSTVFIPAARCLDLNCISRFMMGVSVPQLDRVTGAFPSIPLSATVMSLRYD